MNRRRLKPEEREIWRQVTKSVTPLHPAPADVEAEPASIAPKKHQSTGTGESRAVLKPLPKKPSVKPAPADRSAERRLRRGRIEIDARIDLHGMTQDHARTTLGHFLHGARSRGYRLVLVITGKGKASARPRVPGESAPGILKRRLPDWLAEPELRHLVSGYARAHQRHGGEGAYYVTIRNPGAKE
ncbi:Smr/MutS family protein [Hyphobacterium sp.]|uniref:Smr/MutS family protein n=1 Tax=Hyphobacterium sp. TaxID=2004662 RepID=UPI003BACBC86